MAPDLNAVAAGGNIDYSQPGSSGYNIDQEVTWMDPKNRKLKVLTIGGGVTGILMAYQIQKHCGNIDHVIYEKNADIGGTWLENRYPGAACDIPSHAYTYQFALVSSSLSTNSQLAQIRLRVDEHHRSRTRLTIRTECRLAKILLIQPRHLEVPGQSLRDFRPPQIHDLRY